MMHNYLLRRGKIMGMREVRMSEQESVNIPFYKRKYLINPKFQLRFVFYTVGVALTVIFAVYFTNNHFFDTFVAKGRAMGLESDHIFFVFLGEQKAYMSQLLIGLSIFYFLILTIFGLVFSHRVAGPLHRLNSHMIEARHKGGFGPISFRKSDYFQELAHSYNAHLGHDSAKIKSTKVPDVKNDSLLGS